MAIEVDLQAEAGVRFIRTPEYIWFDEFVQTCQHYRYIGICHGPAGVGKTWAARYYSRWDQASARIRNAYHQPHLALPCSQQPGAKAIYYTCSVTNTPRQLRDDLATHFDLFHQSSRLSGQFPEGNAPRVPPLLLIDEADRLMVNSLDYLRDLYDQHPFGLVLIGMSGLEKRLKRYAQLYSRVGFAHAFRPLSSQDLRELMMVSTADGQSALVHPPFAQEEALAAVIRISRGNFRLLVRLFDQIERLLALNGLNAITEEVVVAAAGLLTIGSPD